jgi:uncharacterized protein
LRKESLKTLESSSGILRKYNGKILIKPTRDPLCGLSRDEFIKQLRSSLAGRVIEAWIFGSFAEETMHHYSDIDLILVKKTDIKFVERSFEFQDIRDIGPEMDILVYTPTEFKALTENPTIGFWNSVVSTMMRIFP